MIPSQCQVQCGAVSLLPPTSYKMSSQFVALVSNPANDREFIFIFRNSTSNVHKIVRYFPKDNKCTEFYHRSIIGGYEMKFATKSQFIGNYGSILQSQLDKYKIKPCQANCYQAFDISYLKKNCILITIAGVSEQKNKRSKKWFSSQFFGIFNCKNWEFDQSGVIKYEGSKGIFGHYCVI